MRLWKYAVWGFYELYINGIGITKGALAPYISNPDHYCYFDRYDIAEYLSVGENVIGVILGNGFLTLSVERYGTLIKRLGRAHPYWLSNFMPMQERINMNFTQTRALRYIRLR